MRTNGKVGRCQCWSTRRLKQPPVREHWLTVSASLLKAFLWMERLQTGNDIGSALGRGHGCISARFLNARVQVAMNGWQVAGQAGLLSPTSPTSHRHTSTKAKDANCSHNSTDKSWKQCRSHSILVSLVYLLQRCLCHLNVHYFNSNVHLS